MGDALIAEARTERPRGLTLLALFLAAGAIMLAYAWNTVHRRDGGTWSATGGPNQSHDVVRYWLEHGYFSTYGLHVPDPSGNTVYRWNSGAFMVTGFITQKLAVAFTGKPDWRLLALHNQIVALLISGLLALLAYRLARRFGLDSLHAIILGVAVQAVHFTFPGNLALYWEMTAQTFLLLPVLAFLLLEIRALDGRRTRRVTQLQALAAFAIVYIEFITGTMFLAAYAITMLVLSDERPPRRQLVKMLLVPWIAAIALHGVQLAGAKLDGRATVGSSFLYRTGLDGDAMFYGDHLDIAFNRDVVRAARPGNRQFLFRWPVLFIAGAAAVLALFIAYLRARAPRLAIVTLTTLLGTYVLLAAVFSQAVALHPYLNDVLLVTPLILALFVMLPAIIEAHTQRTGAIVLITLFVAVWTAMFQLRLYALAFPLTTFR